MFTTMSSSTLMSLYEYAFIYIN